MNIEELFDNELYHNYGMLTTDDANLLTNYLKEEVMEYVAGLQKCIDELDEALRALACEYEYQVCADEHYDKAMAVANSTGKDA